MIAGFMPVYRDKRKSLEDILRTARIDRATTDRYHPDWIVQFDPIEEVSRRAFG